MMKMSEAKEVVAWLDEKFSGDKDDPSNSWQRMKKLKKNLLFSMKTKEDFINNTLEDF